MARIVFNFFICAIREIRGLKNFLQAHKKAEGCGPRCFSHPRPQPPAPVTLSLPPEVGKRLVGIGHAVDVFSAGHRGTFAFESGDQLVG